MKSRFLRAVSRSVRRMVCGSRTGSAGHCGEAARSSTADTRGADAPPLMPVCPTDAVLQRAGAPTPAASPRVRLRAVADHRHGMVAVVGEVLGWARRRQPADLRDQLRRSGVWSVPHDRAPADGSVVAWGWGSSGQCSVPALPAGLTYVEIAGGEFPHRSRAARMASVVAWGNKLLFGSATCRRCPGLDLTSRSRAVEYPLRLRAARMARWWPGATDSAGQCTVPALPPGPTYVGIACGSAHTIARRSDGSVVAWGNNADSQRQRAGPPGPEPYVEDRRAATPTPSHCVRTDRRRPGPTSATSLPHPGLTYVGMAGGYQFHGRALVGMVRRWLRARIDTVQRDVPDTACGAWPTVEDRMRRRPRRVRPPFRDGSAATWGNNRAPASATFRHCPRASVRVEHHGRRADGRARCPTVRRRPGATGPVAS